eukprot:Awhi_evm2s13605
MSHCESIPFVKLSPSYHNRLLSSSKNQPPLEKVIQTGIVPRLVALMSVEDDQLRIESAWTLTNLASGSSDQTQAVVDAGSIPKFIALLNDKNVAVCEQSMWALGNIAGDRSELRDLTLQHGILPPLLHLLKSSYDAYISYINASEDAPKEVLNMMRTCTWALSNLCRGKKPVADLNTLLPSMELLSKLLRVEDKPTLADACWACSFISDLPHGVETVIAHNVSPRLVQLLSYPSADVVSPTLRAIGNIVAGTDVQTDNIISQGALPLLRVLLTDEKYHVRKESCWAISNITAGTPTQVSCVIDAGIIPYLVHILLSDIDPRVQQEASWAVSNAAHSGQDSVIHYLVEERVIEALSGILAKNEDPKTLCVILLAMRKILAAGSRLPFVEGQNRFGMRLEECGGNEIIEGFKSHSNQKVFDGAIKVLRLLNAEEEEATTLGPKANDFGYQFNTSNSNATFNF